jgi:hypothetical protein
MIKKDKFTDKELKTKYNRWMNNFVKGIQEIQNLPQVSQNTLWFVMLQECLFNTESNVFLDEMYKRPNLYNEKDKGILSDVQLAPMNRTRLIEGMKTFVMSSGKKKWKDTLHKIEDSFYRGDY